MKLKDDEIAVVWSVEDVEMQCDWLTRDQALEVLFALKERHDASVGINWDVIHYTADWMFPNPEYAEPDNALGF